MPPTSDDPTGLFEGHEPARRFLQLVDSLPTGVLLQGEGTRILFSNATARDLLGLTEDQLHGRSSFDPSWNVIHEDGSTFLGDEHPVPTAFRTGRAVRNVVMGVWRPMTRDRVWLLVNAEPIARADDSDSPAARVVEVLCTFSDITSRQQIQDLARQSEERLRAMIQNSADGIALATPQGDILFLSDAVERILGFPPTGLVGRNAFEFIHPEDHAEATTRLLALPDTTTTGTTTLRARHRDGTWRWIELTVTQHLDNPHVGALVVNFRDVTERRRLESELLQSQKIETVGRLAGGIAHDFNNLLTAILGYARMLQDQIRADSPLRPPVEEIYRAGERAAALTSQLLAFSRKEVANPRILELDLVLRDMERMLQRLIGEDIRLELALTSAPHRTRIDAGQLQQIILNLVVNAREAMPRGGRLTIRTRREAAGADDAGWIVLLVEDTGIGIDAETQARLFEPFFTTKESGTGLGLATVHSIVRRSGGVVNVRSAPGQGAAFELRFPAQRPATADETAPIRAVRPLATARERVLVVEDDASVRFLVQRTLHDAGYQVVSANNGREAADFLERSSDHFDLVLTDVIMPGLSGPQLLDRVSVLRPKARHLMMSGYTADALRARDAGAAGAARPTARELLLQKPFTPEALLRAVRGAIDRTEGDPAGGSS